MELVGSGRESACARASERKGGRQEVVAEQE